MEEKGKKSEIEQLRLRDDDDDNEATAGGRQGNIRRKNRSYTRNQMRQRKHTIMRHKNQRTSHVQRKLLGYAGGYEMKLFRGKKKLTIAGLNQMLERKLRELRSVKCRVLKSFLENKYVNYVLSIVIFLSIFGDDLRMIFLPKAADIYVDSLMIFISSVFVFEIMTQFIFLGFEYLFSMMFILDLLATLSMGLDMAFISDGYLAKFEK